MWFAVLRSYFFSNTGALPAWKSYKAIIFSSSNPFSRYAVFSVNLSLSSRLVCFVGPSLSFIASKLEGLFFLFHIFEVNSHANKFFKTSITLSP